MQTSSSVAFLKRVLKKVYRVVCRPVGEMRKYEIALLLARRYGFTSYLEICTATTGGTYSRVDREQFSRRKRLMYRCPPGFSDGEPIDYRTEADSGEDLFASVLSSGQTFDVVFVDSFHSYSRSHQDILIALRLAGDNGVVVIHDCNPPSATIAQPEHRDGGWCGVTYAAFIDIVLATNELSYITIDTDFGCGVISKRRRDDLFDYPSNAESQARIEAEWRAADREQQYPLFSQYRTQLLHLISPQEFRRVAQTLL